MATATSATIHAVRRAAARRWSASGLAGVCFIVRRHVHAWTSHLVTYIAVRQILVMDDRRRGEGMKRRRRRHGPLQAMRAFPRARGGRRAVFLRMPEDEEEHERGEVHAVGADGGHEIPVGE